MRASNSCLGRLGRSFARGLVRLYYPWIEVTGRERIPSTGPVLLVANHPNSLIDPAIIGISVRRPVHFLAKAPLFEVPVFGAVLRALGMLPAYRGSDDASQIQRNVETLGVAASYLVKGDAVGLFPEGKSHDALKVEMVRSGAGRIAAQAYRDGARELQIVPLGINFEQKDKFFSSVWVRIGEPIPVAALIDAHENEERRAIRQLTTEIDRQLKETVIHLKEDGWEPFLHELEILFPAPDAEARKPMAALRQRKRIADAMNYFLETDRPRAEAMAQAITAHRELLAEVGLNIRSPILRQRGVPLVFQLLKLAVLLFIGFVPALLGTVHNLIPFMVTRVIARRLQGPRIAGLALARLGIGIPIYLAWYALVGWRAMKHLPLVAVWTLSVLMAFAGVFALHFWPRAQEIANALGQELRMLFQRERLKQFRQAQAELHRGLCQLAQEYAVVRPRD